MQQHQLSVAVRMLALMERVRVHIGNFIDYVRMSKQRYSAYVARKQNNQRPFNKIVAFYAYPHNRRQRYYFLQKQRRYLELF